MSDVDPAATHGAAIGIDHVGIAGADLDRLAAVVYAADAPAENMTRLSRLAGRPAEPDPLVGFRITLARGCERVLPRAVASALFPGARGVPPLIGLTVVTEAASAAFVHAGGVAIRFTAVSG
jgi:hypothetical protein